MRALLSFVLLLGTAAAVARAAEPRFDQHDLFTAGSAGYQLYRIPGVVVTNKGTVLAYCEARKSDKGDWGTINVQLRRSTDGGTTWSEPKTISDVPGPKVKNPVAVAKKLGGDGEVTYNNPVLIVDRKTGAVHFLFCLEYMRCFYARSEDDGQTFSPPVEITQSFEAFRPHYDWKVLATGPAHGIQLTSGRLVVPVWLSLGTGGHAHRPSVTSTIYSDDHGATWKAGEIAVPNTEEWVNPNETVVAQLVDGRVMLNVRSESKPHRRLVTTSPDGIGGWTPAKFDDTLLEPICMASLVRLTGKESDKTRLLFTNPATVDARKKITVRMSYDEGTTWPVSRMVEEGFSGYSDMAILPDHTVVMVYERGSVDNQSPYKSGSLTVARFNVEWLSEGKDRIAAAGALR
jgi:sialidase-1